MSSSKSMTSPLAQRNERKAGAATKPTKTKYHFNTIWSLWYCVVILAFTAYLVYVAYKRFKMYASLPWSDDERPYIELNAHVGLVGSAVVVMPFFIVSSIMKVGNLANDGSKLGSTLSACGRDAPAVLPPTVGIIRNLWIHGFPTAPFLHLVAAFCFFLPKVLMDATLIRAGFMAQDNIWKTDLDVFMFQNGPFFTKRQNGSIIEQINLPLEPSLMNPTESLDTITSRINKDINQLDSRINKRTVEVNWKPGFSHQAENILPSTEFFFKRMPVEKMGKRKSTEDYYTWKPFSPELIYYSIALIVFSVRYSAVFWNTNKLFSFLFSAQLLINGGQTLLTLMSFSILHKMLVTSDTNDLPELRSYLLTPITSLVTVTLAVMVVSASSISLYIYGYQRFCHFVFRSKQRFHIAYEKDPHIIKPQTSLICAMITLIGLSITYGPLLWDLTTVYKRSLNVVVLTCIVGSICYLFQWIVLWIFLSVKNSWTFKLRVTVARAFVSSARSIKLVNDVEMVQPRDVPDESALLIIGKGKAYAVQDAYPQREILDVVQRVREEKKARGNESDIYWLRPSSSKGVRKQKAKNSQQKVTFSDTVQREVYSTKNGERPAYHGGLSINDSDDDGDYALLKGDGGVPRDESGNSSDSSHREEARYVDRRQILAYRQANQHMRDISPPSPILVAPDYDEADTDEISATQAHYHRTLDSQGPMTPRSNRSNDSGMPPESHSQRSDSISSDSANTPAEISEESGIHCVTMENYRHRSSSVDDLTQYPAESHQSPAHPSFPNFHRPALMNINSVYGYCKGGAGAGQYKIIYPSAETTLAIKRQRNMTQEIKSPHDSIYGTKKLSSFTDTVRQDARRNFDLGLPSSHSNSSGYQSSNNSANNSSGSNSAGNSPIPPHPLAPISEHPIIHSNSYDFSNTKPYGRVMMPVGDQYGYPHRITSSSSGKFAQSAQMPMPPPAIPQGAMVPNTGLENLKNEIYGRTSSAQSYHSPGNPLFGHIKAGLPMNRSASLRLPTNSNARKQFTSTLPHLLPKESYYNTNV